jgi:hypothetical protein
VDDRVDSASVGHADERGRLLVSAADIDADLHRLAEKSDDHDDQIYALFDRVATLEGKLSRIESRLRDLDDQIGRLS